MIGTCDTEKVRNTPYSNNDKNGEDFKLSGGSFHSDTPDGIKDFAYRSVRHTTKSIWFAFPKA